MMIYQFTILELHIDASYLQSTYVIKKSYVMLDSQTLLSPQFTNKIEQLKALPKVFIEITFPMIHKTIKIVPGIINTTM